MIEPTEKNRENLDAFVVAIRLLILGGGSRF